MTSVEPVTSTGGVKAPNFALSDHLRCFFGIVAVGTEGGHIYLVDLRLDDCNDYSRSTEPRKIVVITPAMANTAELRRKASRAGEHLCLEVGGWYLLIFTALHVINLIFCFSVHIINTDTD